MDLGYNNHTYRTVWTNSIRTTDGYLHFYPQLGLHGVTISLTGLNIDTDISS